MSATSPEAPGAQPFPRVPSNRRARTAGFTTVTAVFLIVVLAALGAFMVTVSGLQHTSGALDVQGSRAYQAAQAGIEWKMYQVLQPPQPSPNCVLSENLALSGTFSAFTVTVQCQPFSASELGNTVNLYRITSNACNSPIAGACPNTNLNPGPRYLERQLRATVGR